MIHSICSKLSGCIQRRLATIFQFVYYILASKSNINNSLAMFIWPGEEAIYLPACLILFAGITPL